jgi:hypothetical protein
MRWDVWSVSIQPLRLDLQLVVPELDEEHMQDTLAHHGQTKQLFAAIYGWNLANEICHHTLVQLQQGALRKGLFDHMFNYRNGVWH